VHLSPPYAYTLVTVCLVPCSLFSLRPVVSGFLGSNFCFLAAASFSDRLRIPKFRFVLPFDCQNTCSLLPLLWLLAQFSRVMCKVPFSVICFCGEWFCSKAHSSCPPLRSPIRRSLRCPCSFPSPPGICRAFFLLAGRSSFTFGFSHAKSLLNVYSCLLFILLRSVSAVHHFFFFLCITDSLSILFVCFPPSLALPLLSLPHPVAFPLVDLPLLWDLG